MKHEEATVQPAPLGQVERGVRALVPERAAGGALVFWRQWIALQLQHNLDKMARLSIKNFHFQGLNYVCFDFTPEHTIRLYIVETVAQLQTKEVNIHNHLYDSQILCLHGSILNTTYKLDNERDDFNIYALTSALAPGKAEKRIKLEFITRRGLTVDRRILLAPGDTHFQPHTEIHNVENDPQTLTAFMVFEFPTMKKNSRIFTTKNYGDTIPTPGAYQCFEREELRALVSSLLEDMKRSNDSLNGGA